MFVSDILSDKRIQTQLAMGVGMILAGIVVYAIGYIIVLTHT
jgi:hypothetical protein